MKQNSNSESTKLMLNLKEFLAEFFMNRTGKKTELTYGLFWEAVGNNVGNAIDAAWTWFRTGYVNNFISLNPHTKEINLNW